MTEIVMPKLSDTMTEGVFGTWRKSVGERVSRGDIIAEVETDKATMELESFASGVLMEQRVQPGARVPVGGVIGIIGEPGEVSRGEKPAPAPETPAVQAAPQAAPAPGQPQAEERRQVPPVTRPLFRDAEVKAAPVVRRLAREMGVDLEQVHGSGPDGRVLLTDIEAAARPTAGEQAAPTPDVPAAPAAPPREGAAAGGTGQRQEMSRMRAAIAKVVADSWRNIPHFSVTAEFDMDRVEEIRRSLKSNGIQVSLNDLIARGAVMALEKFPQLNASYLDEGIVIHRDIHLSLMIELPDGLIAPVIRNCGGVSLRELADRSRRLIERAKSGAVTQDELSGGTFSLSNLGKYGVSQFSAIILPPQAAILAVGAVHDAVAMRAGQPVAVRRMKATLSADHRVVDGAYAARYLAELGRIMADPLQLLL